MSSSKDAFHFPEVRVVEASAGTGKTYALARRYVQLVLNPAVKTDLNSIRSILAITFTNKAALEMKTRILDFLKRMAFEDLNSIEQKFLLKGLPASTKELSKASRLVMEDIIHHYNFFQVQTIDSFINALLSGCAFKIGLSANFRIQRNSFDYLQLSLDRMITTARAKKETQQILDRFLHQYLFLENKTGWFPKQHMMALVSALFRILNNSGLNFTRVDFKVEDLMSKKRSILELMQRLQEHMPKETDKRFQRILDDFLVKNKKGFDFDKISDYFQRDVIPLKKGATCDKELHALWQKIRKQLGALAEMEAYSLFNPYVEVFQLILQNFREQSRHDDVLFLEELNRKANTLFDEAHLSVEELYFRLATRFRHYLVDEFQDTSVLQWRNLVRMVEEALSTGGSLFYVGDKKQAIYGFRGGEVKLFDHVQNQFAPFSVKLENLETNYRSKRAIVDFNNSVFDLENLKRFIAAKSDFEEEKKTKRAFEWADEDWQEIKNTFQHARQECVAQDPSGLVHVELIDEKVKEKRHILIQERLEVTLEELKKRHPYKNIAVLTRDNKDVELVTTWLLAKGFPVESERTLDIRSNFLIQQIISFFRFLDSPIDNLAFAQFILGDVFIAAAKCSTQELHDYIFALRKRFKQEKEVYLYREFKRDYPEVWENLFEEFFKNIGHYPLYEITVSIIDRFSILKNFPQEQGFVMRFLELIKLREEETTDLTDFLRYFEDLSGEDPFVHATESDAIKVLTIHKAKGLEFPVVLLPFLGMEIHVGTSGDVGQQSFLVDVADKGLELVRIKNKYLPFSKRLRDVYRKQYIKSFVAELNNVYVALTRAVDEMYVFIPRKVGNSFNLVNFLIPQDKFDVGVPVAQEWSQQKQDTLKLSLSQYYNWLDFLKDEFKETTAIVNREQILKGNVMHFLLSQIEFLDQENEGFYFMLEQKAKNAFVHILDFSNYLEELKNNLKHKAIKQFFLDQDAEIFNEMEVVDGVGRMKRIDRVMVFKDHIWVVEYKSGWEDEESHVSQVRGYMDLLRQLFAGKDVSGFLVYLDQCLVRKVSSKEEKK